MKHMHSCFDLSNHLVERLPQRSIQYSSVDVVIHYGTWTRVQGGCRAYFLTKKNISELNAEGFDKATVDQASKIAVVVSESGTVITSYFPSQSKKRQLKKSH